MSDAGMGDRVTGVTARYDDVAGSVQEYLATNAECLGLVYTSWPEQNLSKIAPYAAEIRGLAINAREAFTWDLSLLAEFQALERLVLVEAQKLDLGALPKLNTYRDAWSEGCRLEDCRSIEELCLQKFAPRSGDFRSWHALRSLRDLELRQTGLQSLEGLNFEALQRLEIFRAPKLLSLDGILGAPNLHTLRLSVCKRLNHIEIVAGLEQLEVLVLSRLTVESVGFVSSMKKLRAFRAVESMIGDGKMLPLAAVDDVYFNDKPFYSHRLAQIQGLRHVKS
ncbi:MAG: hypothetical protein IPJ34_20730 [Myxococcales bacterium]|nr:hypothetical protein [Myxococcales bacterium]